LNKEYKRIVVTDINYRKLKGLGSAGDSFNDVITDLLEKINSLQQSTGVPAPEIVVNMEHPTKKEGCR
jgi:predicted CopG family antitoxin